MSPCDRAAEVRAASNQPLPAAVETRRKLKNRVDSRVIINTARSTKNEVVSTTPGLPAAERRKNIKHLHLFRPLLRKNTCLRSHIQNCLDLVLSKNQTKIGSLPLARRYSSASRRHGRSPFATRGTPVAALAPPPPRPPRGNLRLRSVSVHTVI